MAHTHIASPIVARHLGLVDRIPEARMPLIRLHYWSTHAPASPANPTFRRTRSVLARVILFFLLALALSALAKGQDQAGLEQGMKPYGAFHGADIDSISMVNGHLNLHVSLLSYPQRGGKLHLAFTVIYNNPLYQERDNCNGAPRCIPTHYSWSVSYPSSAAINIVPDFYPSVTANTLNAAIISYTVREPDGTAHQMGQTSTYKWISMDATSYAYNSSSNVLTDPSGMQYTQFMINGYPAAVSQIEDTNGNLITAQLQSNGNPTSWTDTLGRSIPAPRSQTTTDFSGCTGTYATGSAYVWTPPGVSGSAPQFKFCYAAFPLNYTPAGCGSNCSGLGGSTSQIQSIVLPNGTAWTFELDNKGALSTITFPTGGSLSYSWNTYSTCLGIKPHGVDSQFALAAASRAVNSNDGTGAHTWTYAQTWSTTGVQTVVTDPNLNDAVHTEGNLVGGGCTVYEIELDQYNGSHTSGSLLKKIATTYNYASDPYTSGLYINVVPLSITVTDVLSGQVSEVTKTYDSGIPMTGTGAGTNALYGDILSQSDYDYGTGSTGPLLRTTKTTYMAFSGPNASFYLANNLLSLPYTVQTLNGSGAQVALTTYGYDESSLISSGITTQHDSAPPSGAYRGNQTSVNRWLNTTNNNLTSTATFYDTGTPPTATDPLTHTTTRAYSTSFAGAYPTTVTNALNQSANHNYDFNTGLLTSTTDPNGLTTSFSYDNMWRLASVAAPDGAVSTITHQESSFPFSATLNKPINTSQTETTTNVFDGLGRLTQSQINSDPQGTVYTDTTYDALERVATVSNPYRQGNDPTTTTGTTTYGYDALGRKTSETYPDGSVLTTAYCGPSTLVTDPTGKWRRSRVDGLGRLVEVDEPNATGATVNSNGCPGTGEPIWITTYGYDTLGNLTSVVQNGSHQRSFVFDSLSRLITSTNPEVGTINYSYNNDGVLISKTDARGITTNYSPSDSPIDSLHRVTKITYSNGDPSLTFAYDQANCLGLSACQNIGHRTSMTDAAGSEAWSFQVDAANHRSVHVELRTTNSITKTSTYYLDQAGNVTQAVYPTSRVVNYTFDNADRPSTAVDGSNGITYATDFQSPPTGCLSGKVCYTPQSTFYAVSIGQSSAFTGLNLTHTYNSRLQPNEFKASSSGGSAIDITYNFVDPSTNKSAGIVYGITNNIDSTRSQTFSYDQLNRITAAQTTSTYSTSPAHCWSETYTVDPWGNLQSLTGNSGSQYTGCTYEVGFSKTADGNNHLSGFSYDLYGNTSNDGYNSYTWNAESQLISAARLNYLYDGERRRVSKSNGKLYWYGSGDDILAETDASGNTTAEYVFFGGKRIAQSNLGSVDVRFTNDSCSGCGGNPVGGGDRNLFINFVTVGSTTVYPNDPSVSYVTPPCNEYANGVGQILCNGDMIVNKPVGAPGQTITVNAYGSTDYNIYPHMQLYLNGVLIGQWDVTGSSQNYTATIPNAAVVYYVEDFLGTSRVLTDASGVLCYDADFYPYGGERSYTNTCQQNYKFEGKERDTESGNDDFGARYYSNRSGRWLSADWSAVPEPVPYANLSNPQTLNLYAMVGDDPESFADLDGHYLFVASGCGDNNKCQKKWDKAQHKFEKRREKDLHSKKAAVREAAKAYGNLGDENGVNVGFADLASQGAYGSVDPSGSVSGQKLVQVTIDFGRAGNSETITHEGTHIGDAMKFLNSFNPFTGGYDQMLNITHGQTEFNAFKAGAEVSREHGFGPNDNQKIWNFLHDSPTYGPILHLPVFDPTRFPAAAPPPTLPAPVIPDQEEN